MKKVLNHYGDRFVKESGDVIHDYYPLGTVLVLSEYSPGDKKKRLLDPNEIHGRISSYKVRFLAEGELPSVTELGRFYGGETFYTSDFFTYRGECRLPGWRKITKKQSRLSYIFEVGMNFIKRSIFALRCKFNPYLSVETT